jgi:uncharacterized membrane protein (UPF0182 family)
MWCRGDTVAAPPEETSLRLIKPRPNRRRRPFLVPVLLLAVLVAGPAMVRLYVDSLWFRELGFGRVLGTELGARAALFALGALVTFTCLLLVARRALRGGDARPILFQGLQGPPRDVTPVVSRAAAVGAAAVAVLLGLSLSTAWLPVVRALHQQPFGFDDPVFGRDIGFYVFTLPVLSTALGTAFTVGVLALLLALALFWVRRDVLLGADGKLRVEPAAGRLLAWLGAALFLLTAARLWLVGLPELLYSSRGPLVGASYTDLHAARPGLHVTAVAAVCAAVLLVVRARQGRAFAGAVAAVAGWALVSLVARGLLPGAVQRLVVVPTELTREEPSLRHHIDLTRRAWGLDRVERRELSGAAQIDLDAVRRNAATVENVRLWDVEPLLLTFGQLQEIRTYYDFVSVDDDRYWIDGRYRQVLLSPRELNSASLPTRTFINEHLTFTHGMGLTLAPVNQATSEGLPVLFVRDLPPRSTVDLPVTRPQIYFGELTDTHVFVGTRQRELDYAGPEENVFTDYAGKAGFPVGGVFGRAVLAAYLGSSNVLLSGDIDSDSRVLLHRDVLARAQKALPFLHFDSDPYMVIREDGTLTWILDAYTRSDRFPYAARLADGTSYVRNSVKVTLDAYDGTVAAYVADPTDPIAATWAAVFPGILLDLAAMPEDVRAHIRYPSELYRTQMNLYTTYHMDDPEELYHREDQWQVPTMPQREGDQPFMRRIIMRLPEEEGEEYIYMTPFTPRQKDNLTAWVVARSDGEHYGQLVEYRFPRQSMVFGPRQIANRINQDTEVSRQLSLWDQRGSTVIRGELMVIPIEEALVYVQPIFLQADGGRIPEMKRVVVAYENQVVMEETLEEGLARIFGSAPPAGATAAASPAEGASGQAAAGGGGTAGGPGAGAAESVTPPAEGAAATPEDQTARDALARRAREHYDRALAAQREGDWAAYGEEIRRLGAVLEQMTAAAAPRQP